MNINDDNKTDNRRSFRLGSVPQLLYQFTRQLTFWKNIVTWVFLFIISTNSPALKAQEISSSAVNFKQTTSGGEFVNCMIELEYTFSDKRLQKKMSALYGGVTLAISKNNDLYWYIKIVTSESNRILPIYSSGLSTPKQTFKARQIPCDDQRQFCGGIAGLNDVLKIYKALYNDQLVLWFNHESGGFDERFPISFLGSFKSKGERHHRCVTSVLEQAMSKYN